MPKASCRRVTSPPSLAMSLSCRATLPRAGSSTPTVPAFAHQPGLAFGGEGLQGDVVAEQRHDLVGGRGRDLEGRVELGDLVLHRAGVGGGEDGDGVREDRRQRVHRRPRGATKRPTRGTPSRAAPEAAAGPPPGGRMDGRRRRRVRRLSTALRRCWYFQTAQATSRNSNSGTAAMRPTCSTRHMVSRLPRTRGSARRRWSSRSCCARAAATATRASAGRARSRRPATPSARPR